MDINVSDCGKNIHTLFTKIILVEDELFLGKFVLNVWNNPFEIIGHSKTNKPKLKGFIDIAYT